MSHSHSFRRLTLRSATGTAQRAIPTHFGVRVKLELIIRLLFDNRILAFACMASICAEGIPS
jgi:hypothetical protein